MFRGNCNYVDSHSIDEVIPRLQLMVYRVHAKRRRERNQLREDRLHVSLCDPKASEYRRTINWRVFSCRATQCPKRKVGLVCACPRFRVVFQVSSSCTRLGHAKCKGFVGACYHSGFLRINLTGEVHIASCSSHKSPGSMLPISSKFESHLFVTTPSAGHLQCLQSSAYIFIP